MARTLGPLMRTAIALTPLLVILGCATSSRPASTESQTAQTYVAPKTLRIGIESEPPRGGIILFSGIGAGEGDLKFVVHAGLTVYDSQNALTPRVAQKVPTVEDGDWKAFPDGRMEVTWKLRPGLTWHDGEPLTAADFAFSAQVLLDPEIPARRDRSVAYLSGAVATDDETLVVSWKQLYFLANSGDPISLPPLPRHLLADLYMKGESQAFINSAYWTTGFVGIGPYRLTEWVSGSHLELSAFDKYLLGRPKIDTLVVRFISDPNALLANLLSGEVDYTVPGSISPAHAVTLRSAWSGGAAGTVLQQIGTARVLLWQFRDPDAPWVPDRRVRQAMAYMLDRQLMIETLWYGFTLPADTIPPTDSPVHGLLEQRGLQRYPYDAGRASRLLADAGWDRGSDQMYRKSGLPLSLEMRSSSSSAEEAEAVIGQWKAAGVDSSFFGIVPNSANERELRSQMKGVYPFNIAANPQGMETFITARIPSAENRFMSGNNNFGGYSNAMMDRLYEQFASALDTNRRLGVFADMLQLLADDVVYMPLYYNVNLAASRSYVKGPGALPVEQPYHTWNLHAWELD